jgi:hypothetical protein
MTPMDRWRRVRPRDIVAFRRRHTAIAFAMLTALAGGACSVPSDGEARAIDPARLDAATSSKRNCTSPGVDVTSITVRVYLVSRDKIAKTTDLVPVTQDALPSVTPVNRVVAAGDQAPGTALDALFNCKVTTEESRSGLASSVPEETQLLGFVEVSGPDGLYEVRLGPLRNRGAKQVDDLDKLAVAQIFFTATAPGLAPKVKGLRFSIDGRAKAVSTDQRTVSQNEFVRRNDFKSSSPP